MAAAIAAIKRLPERRLKGDAVAKKSRYQFEEDDSPAQR
jgi:hypothetical protein